MSKEPIRVVLSAGIASALSCLAKTVGKVLLRAKRGNLTGQTLSNVKLQSSNIKSSPKFKGQTGIVLAFRHLDFNCHLDFDIWG
jgi:hypothetical protein